MSNTSIPIDQTTAYTATNNTDQDNRKHMSYQGYLSKNHKGGGLHTLRKRYFVIRGFHVDYYTDNTKTKQTGRLDLRNVTKLEPIASAQQQNPGLKLTLRDRPKPLLIVFTHGNDKEWTKLIASATKPESALSTPALKSAAVPTLAAQLDHEYHMQTAHSYKKPDATLASPRVAPKPSPPPPSSAIEPARVSAPPPRDASSRASSVRAPSPTPSATTTASAAPAPAPPTAEPVPVAAPPTTSKKRAAKRTSAAAAAAAAAAEADAEEEMRRLTWFKHHMDVGELDEAAKYAVEDHELRALAEARRAAAAAASRKCGPFRAPCFAPAASRDATLYTDNARREEFFAHFCETQQWADAEEYAVTDAEVAAVRSGQEESRLEHLAFALRKLDVDEAQRFAVTAAELERVKAITKPASPDAAAIEWRRYLINVKQFDRARKYATNDAELAEVAAAEVAYLEATRLELLAEYIREGRWTDADDMVVSTAEQERVDEAQEAARLAHMEHRIATRDFEAARAFAIDDKEEEHINDAEERHIEQTHERTFAAMLAARKYADAEALAYTPEHKEMLDAAHEMDRKAFIDYDIDRREFDKAESFAVTPAEHARVKAARAEAEQKARLLHRTKCMLELDYPGALKYTTDAERPEVDAAFETARLRKLHALLEADKYDAARELALNPAEAQLIDDAELESLNARRKRGLAYFTQTGEYEEASELVVDEAEQKELDDTLEERRKQCISMLIEDPKGPKTREALALCVTEQEVAEVKRATAASA